MFPTRSAIARIRREDKDSGRRKYRRLEHHQRCLYGSSFRLIGRQENGMIYKGLQNVPHDLYAKSRAEERKRVTKCQLTTRAAQKKRQRDYAASKR